MNEIEVVMVGSKRPFKARLKRKPMKRSFKAKKPAKRRIKLRRIRPLLRDADEIFSDKVRKRDGQCLFPDCPITAYEKLQCSHYFGRGVFSTRFDLDNCISLCWLHHFKDKMLGYEYQKQRKEDQGWDGQYTLFMKEWLGNERWAALVLRSKESVKQRETIQSFLDKGKVDKPDAQP